MDAEAYKPKFLFATPVDVGRNTGDSVHVRSIAIAMRRREMLAGLLASGELPPRGVSEIMPHFHSIGPGKRNSLLRALQLFRFIKRHSAAASVIHVRDVYTATIALLATPRRKSDGIILLYEINGFEAPLRVYATQDRAPRVAERLFRHWIGAVLARADKIVYVSDNYAAHYQKVFPGFKGTLVANGVDTQVYKPISEMRRQELRHHKGLGDGPILCFVGSLLNEMGLETVLNAMPEILSEIPSASLLIVGDGEARDPLESLANELGIQDSVRFAGMVPEETAAEYMAVSDVGLSTYSPSRVSTSRTSSSPYSIKELSYLSAGIPVLTTFESGFLLENKVGFVAPSTHKEFAASAVRILRNPAALRDAGERARMLIVSRFSWDRSAEELARVVVS